MFLEVQSTTTCRFSGEDVTVTRYVNLNQASAIGAAEGVKKTQGYKSVIYMPNGWAYCSKLNPQEIFSQLNTTYIKDNA